MQHTYFMDFRSVRLILLADSSAHQAHLQRLRDVLEGEAILSLVNVSAFAPGLNLPKARSRKIPRALRIVGCGGAAAIGKVIGSFLGLLPGGMLRRLIDAALRAEPGVSKKVLRALLLSGDLRLSFQRIASLWEINRRFGLGKPDTVVVLPEENILATGITQGLFLREIGARTVVFNYSFGVEEEWSRYFRQKTIQDWPLVPTKKNFSYSKIFYGRRIWLPRRVRLESKVFNFTPAKPWSGYLGLADLYLVDSKRELPSVEFIPNRKVLLVDPVELHGAKIIASRLDMKVRFSGLGVMVPPNQWKGTRKNHDYLRLLKDISEIASAVGGSFPVSFSLHPREAGSEEAIARILGISPSDFYPLPGLTARSKVVLQFGSASMRLFEALGLSIIDWDVFQYETAKTLMTNPDVTLLHVESVREAVCAISAELSQPLAPSEVPAKEWGGLSAIMNLAKQQQNV